MDKRIYAEPWYVYIVECSDKTLYVGIAKDVAKRIRTHNTTKECRYTRFRQPVVLRYSERCPNHYLAYKRELKIKSFPRKKKLDLISAATHPSAAWKRGERRNGAQRSVGQGAAPKHY